MTARDDDLSALLERLFTLPVDQFTAARNELSKQLRKEGHRAEADRLKGLAKPTVAAWALNQLYRREPAQFQALREAGEALASAQREMIRGAARDAFQQATKQERQVVLELTRAAEKVLGEAGHAASPATLERVATTLRALAAQGLAASAEAAGQWTRDLEPAGFDALLASSGLGATHDAPATPPIAPPASGPTQAERKRLEEQRRLEKMVAAAEAVVARLSDAAGARASECEEAENRLRQLRRETHEAESAAALARQRAGESQTQVDRAQAKLDEARAALREHAQEKT